MTGDKSEKDASRVRGRSNYKIIKRSRSAPILGHIPHSATKIPSKLRSAFVLSDRHLAAELIRMTDAYTDELFESMKNRGVLFVNKYSRLVMDPERFEDDSKEIMSKRGMGVVYTKTSDGCPLKKPLTREDRDTIIKDYYRPYHERLTGEVGDLVKKFGECLIVDGHSFPSKPLPYELSRSADRPDICIGTDAFHTPMSLRNLSVEYFRARGLKVSVNRPFAGSLVPMKFYKRTKKVRSIMIEVNRKLYMDEGSGHKSARFGQVKKLIDGYLNTVICEFATKHHTLPPKTKKHIVP